MHIIWQWVIWKGTGRSIFVEDLGISGTMVLFTWQANLVVWNIPKYVSIAKIHGVFDAADSRLGHAGRSGTCRDFFENSSGWPAQPYSMGKRSFGMWVPEIWEGDSVMVMVMMMMTMMMLVVMMMMIVILRIRIAGLLDDYWVVAGLLLDYYWITLCSVFLYRLLSAHWLLLVPMYIYIHIYIYI